jgi:hypothetical protein
VQRRDREETQPWLLISHQHRSRLRNFPGTQNRPERDAAEPALTPLGATYGRVWTLARPMPQNFSSHLIHSVGY